ncbi:MAG: trigger factor, partial [Actinomycetes bacterium]
MKSSVETLNPTRVRLTVEVPFSELKPSLDSAYKRIAAQISIPGFRKGRVPAMVIDQRVGRGVVLEEAVNEHLPKAYNAAVDEHKVKPLGQPELDVTPVEDGADLTFTAEVDVRPEIELPDYTGIPVTVDDATVSEEDVAEQLRSLQARFASLTVVDRPVEDGDFVTIDLSAADEGEAIEDAS